MTEKEIVSHYNKLGFLAPIMIEIIDYLKETTQYKQGLKFHLNRALKECEKILEFHHTLYDTHGEIEQQQEDLKPIHSRDIYNLTSKAYDKAFEFFTQRDPSEIVSIIHLIEKLEKDGVKLTDINIDYEPVKN